MVSAVCDIHQLSKKVHSGASSLSSTKSDLILVILIIPIGEKEVGDCRDTHSNAS